MTTTEQGSGRRYRGVSEQDRKEERRLKFIQAATELFGTKGYHGSTVRSICQAAGITERYFYESFANSEDLFCATYEYLINELRMELLAATQNVEGGPEAVARRVLTAFYGFMKARPLAARITFIEVLGVSPRVDELYRSTTEGFARLLLMVAKALYARQTPDEDYSEEWLATGVVGAVIVITHRWVLEDFKTSEDVVVHNAYGIFRAVIRQWLDVPPEVAS